MDHGHCRLTVIHATAPDFWRQARRICEETLTQGFTFVTILRGVEVLSDESLLVEQDRQRAARFRQSSDRHNFVLGRTLVHYLVRPRGAPVPYRFSLGAHGKPFLPGAAVFNLSHSGCWLACAVGVREPIGIDIETFARLGDYRKLLPSIAHPAERHCIDQAPLNHRLTLFKRCWTRKEAALKATGMGLNERLQNIDVCLDQDEPIIGQPASLRLLDLPMREEAVTVALAQAPSTPAAVVMVCLPDISRMV